MRVLLFAAGAALIIGCKTSAQHVSCGAVLLGGNGRTATVFAGAGDRCDAPLLSVTASSVETRSDGTVFHARGRDADGAPFELSFEFSSPSGSCTRCDGTLRIAKGDRVVLADKATFSPLD